MQAKDVVIIGGGLAGMTAARELRKSGMQVTLIEASQRLGGKAGAELHHGKRIDHGFHLFPAWYLNTRQLIRDLGIQKNLIDIHKTHHLDPGRLGKTIQIPSFALRNVWKHLTSGMLPVPHAILWQFFALDLMASSLRRASHLDRISMNGFMRSRLYATERIAQLTQQAALQASSIPGYELSAKTAQKIIRAWTTHPDPFCSVFNGNLQDRFIAPFEQALAEAGVRIHMGAPVRALVIKEGRVSGLVFDPKVQDRPDVSQADTYVLATPLAETFGLVGCDEVFLAERIWPRPEGSPESLSDVANLESAPMAALHLPLRRKIRHMPSEHLLLRRSEFLLSFIDISQHWVDDEGARQFEHTTLDVVASDYKKLANIEPEAAKELIIREIQRFIPEIADRDIDWEGAHMQPNLDAPLFLNTIGSWRFRPAAKTRFPNVFAAGDYCRTEADLTSMESAVISGLLAAREIAGSRVKVLEIENRTWLLEWAAKMALTPAMFGLRLGLRLFEDERFLGVRK